MKKRQIRKNDEIGPTGEMIIKIFLISIMVIMSFALIYGSIKWIHLSLTATDKQICKNSNATLINGLCHSESDQPVKEKRNILLIGGIALPIFGGLFALYIILVLKTQFKKK